MIIHMLSFAPCKPHYVWPVSQPPFRESDSDFIRGEAAVTPAGYITSPIRLNLIFKYVGGGGRKKN